MVTKLYKEEYAALDRAKLAASISLLTITPTAQETGRFASFTQLQETKDKI